MQNEKLNLLISMLPENLLHEALAKFIFEKALGGELEAAVKIFDDFVNLNPDERLIGEVSRFLIAKRLSRGEMAEAMRLYHQMACYGASFAILEERLKAIQLFANAFLPERPHDAYEIWKEYAKYPLNEMLKWHWAQTGILLLDFCCKNIPELAKSVLDLLNLHAVCSQTERILEQANKMYAKI